MPCINTLSSAYFFVAEIFYTTHKSWLDFQHCQHCLAVQTDYSFENKQPCILSCYKFMHGHMQNHSCLCSKMFCKKISNLKNVEIVIITVIVYFLCECIFRVCSEIRLNRFAIASLFVFRFALNPGRSVGGQLLLVLCVLTWRSPSFSRYNLMPLHIL